MLCSGQVMAPGRGGGGRRATKEVWVEVCCLGLYTWPVYAKRYFASLFIDCLIHQNLF